MAVPLIISYTHRCIVPDGDMAGNKFAHEVTAYEVETQETCSYCHEPLGPVDAIVAHIYEQLT